MKFYTYFNNTSSLIDFAVALITGSINSVLFAGYTAGALGAENQFMPQLLLESNIIALNGNVNGRNIIGKDDDDEYINIPTNGKAVQGNLLVAYRDSGADLLGTATESVIDSYMNDLRGALNDVEVQLVSGLATTNDKMQANSETYVVGYGFLKETQSDNYNPLSIIDPAWQYKMFDSQEVQALYDSFGE